MLPIGNTPLCVQSGPIKDWIQSGPISACVPSKPLAMLTCLSLEPALSAAAGLHCTAQINHCRIVAYPDYAGLTHAGLVPDWFQLASEAQQNLPLG